MSYMPLAPKPKSLLGYHRILSPSAGVRVSPLCLGAMSFGEAWKAILGECSKENSFALLDYFYENGGNFIDTANHYQEGESETWVGEWMQQRGNRDEIVLASKYTTGFDRTKDIKANLQGNHSKSLRLSVNASLKKLQTDYIDLLYVHWWDFTTSVPEIMNSLHILVQQGKVLYLGISDTPAWLVVKCNDYARFHGLTPFAVYQGQFSAACRDLERDVIPMCESEGMGIAPWGALGRGQFYVEEKEEGSRKAEEQTENHRKISAALDKLAKEKATAITSIAIAYVMRKTPYVFPIVGGRKIEHLKSNIEALGVQLSDEETNEIDDAVPFDIGFPMNFLFEFDGNTKYRTHYTSSDIRQLSSNTRLDCVPKAKPIAPRQGEA